MDLIKGEFVPVIHFVALDTRVLVVARTRVEGSWAAYVGPVAGHSHDNEKYEVLQRGTKLSEPLARFVFRYRHELTDLPYAY